jgi:hypothetical protein
MPRASGSTIAAIFLLAAGPAGAATVVLMPAPSSMERPRVFIGAGDPDDIYVCTSPTEPGGGRCSLHRAHPRPRH